jgi:hypothetical protein
MRRPRRRRPWIVGAAAAVVVVVGVAVAAAFAFSGRPVAEEPRGGPSIAPWESRTHDPEEDAAQREQWNEETTVGWDDLASGDCWRYDENDWTSGYVDVVDCDLAHSDEIFLEYTLTGTAFPGDKVLRKEADTACMTEFGEFVGVGYADSELDFWTIVPTEQTWSMLDDRVVQCSIYDPESGELTGSLEGAGR